MLPQHLIERALVLTGINENEFIETHFCGQGYDGPDLRKSFSIEKFCYYLLSPEFVEKFQNITEFFKDEYGHTIYEYRKIYKGEQLERVEKEFKAVYYDKIGEAIYEYQEGNEEPLISLLSKI